MKGRFLPLFFLAGILLGGCKSRDARGARVEQAGSFADQQEPAPLVRLLDKQGLHKLVHDRNGKILLLNFWATWCGPCVEEFPDLIRLSKFYGNNGVEVIGISVDYPDEAESKVIPFLKKHQVPFKIYIAKFDKQEDFIDAVDSSWNGAVPATFIYTARGNRQYSWIGQGTYSRFKEEIEKMKADEMY